MQPLVGSLQGFECDGLSQVCIESGVLGLLHIGFLTEAAERDTDHRSQCRHSPQPFDEFQSVHARHADIGQNHVRHMTAEYRQRLLGAGRRLNDGALAFEQKLERFNRLDRKSVV